MCAKLNQVLSRLLPEGVIKETFRSSHYSLYYNRKHFKENGFRVYYKGGHFEYRFDEGVAFSSYENMADELKRSLKGYLARHSLRSGGTVVDCGAYIGEFTLYAAKAVGAVGRVIAFEPDGAIFKKLLANIELNGLKNVTALNKGLWSRDGILKFVGDSIRGYSFMFAENSAGAVDAPVVSLDSELARLGIGEVDFIKADIEGAELELLNGAGKTLKRGTDLAIASYHAVDGEKTCFKLEKMLALIGYKAETAYPGHLTTYGRKI
jgi:FkbM family methyltransferase